MCKVLVCVVNYKNEQEVLDYARNLSNQTALSEIHLLVTNNASSSSVNLDLEQELSTLPISACYYEPGKNLGYLTGALYGYRQYMVSAKKEPLWVIVSNTDIEIKDSDFFLKMITNDYSEDIWCLAPSVYSASKKTYDNPQYTERISLSKLNRLIWIHERPLLAFLYAKLSKMKAKFTRKKKMGSRYVYSAHGCFFALRMPFIDLLKSDGYSGVLFSEEAYIAENILLSGGKAFYDSSLEVVHNDSSVTGLLKMSLKAELVCESLMLIRSKFYYV